ncbi:MAG: cytochrome c biogenesis protein ResB [Elusimicrobia bacterium]|nr:cytochrome c biogenesis protein ResB [Elusimicrobiota bacterium]
MSKDIKGSAGQPGPGWGAFLASPKLLYWLLPALIVMSVAGTLVPQGEARDAYAGRFGVWAGLLLGLRVDDIYHSWPFTALLALLALNLGLCTWRRRAGFNRRRDVLTTHVGVLVTLAGGVATAVLGQRGSMPFHVGELRDRVESAAGAFTLPFSVRLERFEVERHDADRHHLTVIHRKDGWAETVDAQPGVPRPLHEGTASLVVVDYYPDFAMDEKGPSTRSQSPNNPALRVEVSDGQGKEKHWVFARFAGFHANPNSRYELTYELAPGRIKQFRSDIEVLDGGWVAGRASVSVNTPFRWKGWAFYQSGYDPDNPDYSNLLVSRDPGVPLVYAGFLLLCVGVAWTYVRGGRQSQGGAP